MGALCHLWHAGRAMATTDTWYYTHAFGGFSCLSAKEDSSWADMEETHPCFFAISRFLEFISTYSDITLPNLYR